MIDNLTGILMSIKTTDIIDIVVVAYLLYRLLGFIKETRAQQLFRGILLIVAFFLISEIFNLSLLNWLFTRLITVGLIAVVILFQPEIRRGLEQIGRRGVFSRQFRDLGKEEIYATVHRIVDSVDDFSSTHTGALMAIERETMLNDIAETGVMWWKPRWGRSPSSIGKPAPMRNFSGKPPGKTVAKRKVILYTYYEHLRLWKDAVLFFLRRENYGRVEIQNREAMSRGRRPDRRGEQD